jgi:glycosyltransferase involved in cell wall biosynthesis
VKIAQIAAGAAGMYCGSCLHDNTLAAAMIKKGHDVALIPTYTPIRTDEDDVSIDRVFYGAVNVYLEQKSALFRHTPWLVDRLLNRRGVLDWASGRSATVEASHLGDLTLSVLEGEHGKQAKELERLVAWLRDELHPEIVILPNSMFLGAAARIRRELEVPVLCAVQGEDLFLEQLVEPWHGRVAALMRKKAGDVDGFLSMSGYYADYMAGVLRIDRSRFHVVPLGLKLDGHGDCAGPGEGDPFVIGYLARLCPEKGLHLLVESFRQLAERVGRERVLLRIAGYRGERDREYVEGICEQIHLWGLDDRVEMVGEVDRAQKIEFLSGLHVLSVPTVYREPKGLFVLEALANGVPVVLPRHGAFPEMIDATGGGVLFEPGSTDELAACLQALMDDPARRASLAQAGKSAVHERHSDGRMAEQTLELLAGFVTGRAGQVAPEREQSPVRRSG